MTLAEYAKQLRTNGMQCNCDLDNWQPEPETGHSWVCRIHKATMNDQRRGIIPDEAPPPPTAIAEGST